MSTAMSEEDIPLTKRSKTPIKRAGKVEDDGLENGVGESVEGGKVKILNGTTPKKEGKEQQQLQKEQQTKSTGKKTSDKPAVQKKVYDLAGQTKETPSENDPERVFYMTCLEQRPESHMSKKWCLQHGLLPEDQIEKFLEEEGKLKKTTAKTPNSRVKKDVSKPTPVSKSEKKTPAKTPRKTPAKKNEALEPKPVKPRKEPTPRTRKPRAKANAEQNSDEEQDVPLSARGKSTTNSRQKQTKTTPANKRPRAKKQQQEDNNNKSEDEEEDLPLSKRTKLSEVNEAASGRSRRTHNKSIIENSSDEEDVPLSARARK